MFGISSKIIQTLQKSVSRPAVGFLRTVTFRNDFTSFTTITQEFAAAKGKLSQSHSDNRLNCDVTVFVSQRPFLFSSSMFG